MTQQPDPALYARMEKLVWDMSAEYDTTLGYSGPAKGNRHYHDAYIIRSELPEPVDPDLLLAREVADHAFDEYQSGQFVPKHGSAADGGMDRSIWVYIALQAIKRVRQQEATRSACPCKDASSGRGS